MVRTVFTTALICLAFTGAGQADVPRVATDIAPVHGLVARVMQGVGSPDLVVQPGASPHGYSLRPSEALALNRADFVFWMGEGLTPWLEGSIETLASGARVIELLHVEGGIELAFREGAKFSQHEEQDHDGHDDHDHAGIDPHAWLAPDNGMLWLDLIAAELASYDPDNAEIYRANAKAGRAEIAAVVEAIDGTLEPLRSGGFVVFHDAYQYFEASFGLSALGAISLSDATAPSPARITEIRNAVAEFGVSCVFSEPQFSPGLVATVLDGTGAKTAVIDPMGTALPLGPQFYPSLLLDLGQQIAECY